MGSHVVVIKWWLGLELSEDLTQLSTQDGSLMELSVDSGCQLRAQLDFQLESLHLISLGNLAFIIMSRFPEEESKCERPKIFR